VEHVPLLIDFAAPTSLLREQHRISTLPIVGNGPPGTFVLFSHGLSVSLPTDQIVFADDTGGHARVGFGGMRFVGLEAGRLVRPGSRTVPGGSAVARAQSHDAARPAMGRHNFSRRPAGLARRLTARASAVATGRCFPPRCVSPMHGPTYGLGRPDHVHSPARIQLRETGLSLRNGVHWLASHWTSDT
jgi:hypothetical protein